MSLWSYSTRLGRADRKLSPSNLRTRASGVGPEMQQG